MTRESHLVELVDQQGTAIGSARVDAAHRAPGQLHRAFSVLLMDADGQVLLQQRAAGKTRFPLRWGNTACGHPAPGEDLAEVAARRLSEEVGIDGVELTPIGVYPYYAEDPDSGRVEYEYDHVLVGTVPAAVATRPDPAEVAELRWVLATEVRAAVAADSRTYVPWLSGVLDVAISVVRASPPSLAFSSPAFTSDSNDGPLSPTPTQSPFSTSDGSPPSLRGGDG